MFKKIYIFILIIISIQFTSCSKYQKLLKSDDNEYKYEMAVKYYNEGDYNRALQLFDQLINISRGTDKAENIYYYYAYCYYNQNDYVLASYYFKRFAKNFPNNKLSEECRFMSAYCKYLDSPVYSLDQTNTREAINDLQLFINLYPNSDRVSECNDLIDKLRAKLEKKAFNIAKLYYNMTNYKAAIYAFKNILKDYPETKHKEAILLYILKSNYYYAKNSIDSKKSERYQDAVSAYNTFVSHYSESKFLKEAKTMRDNSLKAINKKS